MSELLCRKWRLGVAPRGRGPPLLSTDETQKDSLHARVWQLHIRPGKAPDFKDTLRAARVRFHRNQSACDIVCLGRHKGETASQNRLEASCSSPLSRSAMRLPQGLRCVAHCQNDAETYDRTSSCASRICLDLRIVHVEDAPSAIALAAYGHAVGRCGAQRAYRGRIRRSTTVRRRSFVPRSA